VEEHAAVRDLLLDTATQLREAGYVSEDADEDDEGDYESDEGDDDGDYDDGNNDGGDGNYDVDRWSDDDEVAYDGDGPADAGGFSY
jgi:hypothetical protein